jgi:hypothetical protein
MTMNLKRALEQARDAAREQQGARAVYWRAVRTVLTDLVQWSRDYEQDGLMTLRLRATASAHTEPMTAENLERALRALEAQVVTDDAELLTIVLPTRKVAVVARGWNVLGADGRLDLVSPPDALRLVLHNGKWKVLPAPIGGGSGRASAWNQKAFERFLINLLPGDGRG